MSRNLTLEPEITDRGGVVTEAGQGREPCTGDGTPVDAPWEQCFLTCAAPYAPRLGQPLAGDLLQSRIRRVLAIAAAYGYPALVLGAWGCGAFGNDPARTARDFHAALAGDFAGAFAEVVFAISDWSPERRVLAPFAAVFRPEA